ncbi:glycogen debranching protein GlgX [Entomospira culicis]|uniref:Glycogen debranching protein GlgX n=1 Tax=Entomospira culicis TaxID=2719989 RepID=A0A968GJ00_9SPIO|nr:glycogen debranching protein GlgX [Entomospira culicis]NIZ19540.1 glycogen debranching protein GlgX [Entomospira culicis]NIZ69555.1 glycogen debranching protein GlgX [Entomospira culicis]WDI36666.1 glycogen debranching protein GlgX [Entomospira culicis]WDI38295.1 glycogen debranching protein GlgX [Entomospira culicis]
MKEREVSTGSPLILGATVHKDGVNFAIYSHHAEAVALAIFAKAQDYEPRERYQLDPTLNRTGDVWHIFVHDLPLGAFYGYYIDGIHQPQLGHRFDSSLLLLDPYARAVTGSFEWDFFTKEKRPKSIVYEDTFDWQGDRPIHYPLQDSVIYEVHLKGLSHTAGKSYAGTYLGVIEMIPYFKELGITSVEFLPLMEFDDMEYAQNGSEEHPLRNYWGYSTMSFFAPKARYAVGSRDGDQVIEFKTMVRELHKAGIEVIMDVVYNHTHEGNEHGPVVSFKGIDNSVYYMLYEDKRYYWNYAGTGNTTHCYAQVMTNLIIDSLRYWVVEMHVDGFRFDLATILSRDSRGYILDNPPLLRSIMEDPVLQKVKMIAEPWDAGGGYQVGHFPGKNFAEWNDRYRDDVRRYWRNDYDMAAAFATRVAGSHDLYGASGKRPYLSINYVTAHDGFTLHDLVSYSHKYNYANGQNNTDGTDNNLSWNSGVEGESSDPNILKFRKQRMKNFLATLFLSQGTPMMLGGDEFGRTQYGNNNTYCQDNELSWFDWQLAKSEESDLMRFTKELIHFRRRHNVFGRKEFFKGYVPAGGTKPDIIWFGCDGHQYKWHKQDNALGVRYSGEREATGLSSESEDVMILFNPTHESKTFYFPLTSDKMRWKLKIDTGLPSPRDILPEGVYEELVDPYSYTLMPHSLAVLICFPQ